jgi:hypothetical protein
LISSMPSIAVSVLLYWPSMGWLGLAELAHVQPTRGSNMKLDQICMLTCFSLVGDKPTRPEQRVVSLSPPTIYTCTVSYCHGLMVLLGPYLRIWSLSV